MKFLKYNLIVALLAFAFTSSGQESLLNNGRSVSANPAPKQIIDKKISSDQKEQNQMHDFDDPSAERITEKTDWSFPIDLEAMKENLLSAAGTEDLQNRMDVLSDQIYDLILFNEKLRLENQDIKKSLQQCCQASNGENLSFLLQNAPNPFTEITKIDFFLDKEAVNAVIELRSIEGQILGSYPIDTNGYGSIELESADLNSGYYVYTLFNDNKVIDSKVLVLVD